METIQTRSVLAGAYRASDKRSGLTHAVFADGMEPGTSLCGRVKSESLADGHASDPSAEPTCKRCLGWWKAHKKVERMFPR